SEKYRIDKSKPIDKIEDALYRCAGDAAMCAFSCAGVTSKYAFRWAGGASTWVFRCAGGSSMYSFRCAGDVATCVFSLKTENLNSFLFGGE
ncbi:hypothetical protein Avbf_03277, partial [Armadillidium vulgare]